MHRLYSNQSTVITVYFNSVVFSCKFHGCHGLISEEFSLMSLTIHCFLDLKAKFQCHPARCLLPVEIMQRCGLATGPATVELLPYL